MKRRLESSICWRRNGEEAEADDINPIPKRPCTGRDGDGFEEFLAVLKQIKATRRYSLSTRNDLNRQEPALKCIKTVASNAFWRPSFEWEDFSNHGKTRNVQPDSSAVKSGDGRVEEEEVVRHASNNLKRKASTNPDLEGLDLNSLPAELLLFQ